MVESVVVFVSQGEQVMLDEYPESYWMLNVTCPLVLRASPQNARIRRTAPDARASETSRLTLRTLRPYWMARSFCLAPDSYAVTSVVRWAGERRRWSGRGIRSATFSMVASAAAAVRREGPESSPSPVSGTDRRSSMPSTCGGVFKVASIRSTDKGPGNWAFFRARDRASEPPWTSRWSSASRFKSFNLMFPPFRVLARWL